MASCAVRVSQGPCSAASRAVPGPAGGAPVGRAVGVGAAVGEKRVGRALPVGGALPDLERREVEDTEGLREVRGETEARLVAEPEEVTVAEPAPPPPPAMVRAGK